MDFEEIKSIYGRLEEIKVPLESKTILNPRYISEKIGQCHICIEEVEKFYIRVSREMSILQRALNNSEAGYYVARDELIANVPEIATLPSSQSREAKANTMLKDQLDEIKNYKSQLSDLEKIFNTINVKLKNLNRTNSDIKIQLRLMESQIKLGAGGVGDPIEKNLMDELKNTAIGVDILEGADSRSEETSTVDPTKPIGLDIFSPETEKDFMSLESSINDLLSEKVNNVSTSGPSLELPVDVIVNLSDPSFFVEVNNDPTFKVAAAPDSDSENTQPGQDSQIVDLDRSLTGDSDGIPVLPAEPVIPVSPVDELEQPEDYFNGYVRESEETFPEDDLLASVEPSKEIEPESKPTELNLDLILNPVTPIIVATTPAPVPEVKAGGEEKVQEISPIIESQPKTTLQEKPKNTNEIDFSALLSQFN